MFDRLFSQKSATPHRLWMCVFSFLGVFLLQIPGAFATPSTQLDEAAFRKHAAERIRIMKGNKDPRFLQATEKHISIEKTAPIVLPTGTLYGVKFRVTTPTDEKESEVVTLIVDATGTFIYPDVQELATGKSLAREALSELRTIEHIDPTYGMEIYRGSGTHDVILISDPFCPHCRKGWGWLMENKGKLRSLRIAHFPLSPASEAACMVLADLKQLGVKPMEAEDFAYTFLNPTNEPKEVIHQFLEGFAEFKKANGEDTEAVLKKLEGKYQEAVRKERADAQAIGVMSTPTFFVDGKMVDGFNPAKMGEVLQ